MAAESAGESGNDLEPKRGTSVHPSVRIWFVVTLLAVLVVGVWLRTLNLGDPWERGHRGVLGGGYFSVFSEAFDERGLANLWFFPTFAIGDVTEPFVYWHHPPTFSVTLYQWTEVFGRTEASMRGFSLLWSFAFLVVFFEFVRRRGGATMAWFATACAAVLPMATSFAGFVSYEPMLLFFGTLGVFAFVHFHRTGHRGSLLGCLLATTIAMWIDWPGYFYWVGYALVWWLQPRGARRWLPGFGFFSIGVLGFLLLCTHIVIARQALGEGGVETFVEEFRAFLETLRHDGAQVTAGMWWQRHLEYFGQYFGWAWCLAGGVGLLLGLFDARHRTWIVASAPPAILNITFFWSNAYGHPFHTYFFVPWLAYGCGLLFQRFVQLGTAAAHSPKPSSSPVLRIGAWVLALGWTAFAGWRSIDEALVEHARTKTEANRELGALLAEHTGSRDLILTSKNPMALQFYALRAMHIGTVLRPADLRAVASAIRLFGIRYEEVYYGIHERQLEPAAALLALLGPPVAERGHHHLYRLPEAVVERFLPLVDDPPQ